MNNESITDLMGSHGDLLAALKEAREILESYEEELTGELYNNPYFNKVIERAEEV